MFNLKKGAMRPIKKILGVALMASIAINLFTHGKIISFTAPGYGVMAMVLFAGILLLKSGSQE